MHGNRISTSRRQAQLDARRAEEVSKRMRPHSRSSTRTGAKHWTSRRRLSCRAKRETATKLAESHLRAVEVKNRRREEEAQMRLAVVERAQRAMEADTIDTHKYAEGVIKDYAETGKNVIPLVKELREFKKRVMD